VDLVGQIERRKLEFLYQTAEATVARLLPGIKFFQGRLQSEVRQAKHLLAESPSLVFQPAAHEIPSSPGSHFSDLN